MEVSSGTIDLNSLENGTLHVVITKEAGANQQSGTQILQIPNETQNSVMRSDYTQGIKQMGARYYII